MSATRQVICMRWGDRYGREYVERLYAMARRWTTGPLRFVCLTDQPEGLRPEVECHPCPEIDLPLPYRLYGWRKVTLFAPPERLFGLAGDWLYLDLDVVVTGSLDDFFTYAPDRSFVVMQNWRQRGKGIGNTSVYRFRAGADSYLLDTLRAEQGRILKEFPNSQTYISRTVRELTFWPDEWCLLFKVHCVPPWPVRYWRAPVLPPRARVVAFPGQPDPHQAVVGEWPTKRPIDRLYKHIRPAPWIGQAWEAAEAAARRDAPGVGH